MDASLDYYQILGVPFDARLDTIRASYRSLIQLLNADPSKAATYPSLSIVNEAFRTLTDSRARASYDALRRTAHDEFHPAAPSPSVERPVAVATPGSCPFCASSMAGQAVDCPDSTCARCGAPLFPAQRHAQLSDSRRLFDRLPFAMRVHFQRAQTPQVPDKGVSADLSLGGMRLVTSSALAPGERLLIACEFCTAVALVRHTRLTPDSTTLYESGLQFVTLALKRQRGALLSASA